MTVGQQALWALGRLAASPGFGNLCTALQLSPSVNVSRLEAALSVLYARHDILRARLVTGAAGPCIATGNPDDMDFVVRRSEAGNEAEPDAWIDAEAQRPFDLAVRMCRFALLLQAPAGGEAVAKAILLLTVHHIVGDFRSIEILTQELELLYRGGSDLVLEPPEPGSAQFLDYARHEQAWLASREAEQQARFWRQRLSRLDDQQLPRRSSGTNAVFFGVEHRQVLSGPATTRIRSAANALGVTPFTFMLSMFGLTVAALTRHTTLAVGTTVDLRRERSLRRAVGYLVNTVPVVLHVEQTEPFATFALEAARSIASSVVNGKLPFARIARQRLPGRDAARPFTLGASLTWLKFEPAFGAGGASDRLILDTLRHSKARLAPNSHALTLAIEDRPAGLECIWSLDMESFAPQFGDQIAQCLSDIAASAADDVTQPVGALIATASAALVPSGPVMETLEL
jgi:hypothetical protein